MIPYCDTPRQSVVISLLAGLVGGVIGIYLQSLLVVVVATVGLAIMSEILVHEYRQDDQYVQAKQQLFSLV
jgi:Flp pilus assembly protein TadB